MNVIKRACRGCVIAVAVCAVFSPTLAVSQTNDADVLQWPLQLDGERGQIIIYQPQIESYRGNTLEARAAVSVTRKGESEAVFGAMWFEARMSTDLDARLISCEDLNVTAATFPTLEDSQVEQISSYLESEVPKWQMDLDLDQFLATVEQSEARGDDAPPLNNDPPEFIFVQVPTVLVIIDGDPKLADMEGYDLKYVANSAFFIAQDPTRKRYYLRGGDYWYVSSDLMGGWKQTGELPSEIQKVSKAIDEEIAKQKADVADRGAAPEAAEEVGESRVPEIVVRTGPAELIQTDGDPEFVPLQGTQLLYVENTETDILMDLGAQTYYILISGRWYQSNKLDGGNWTFVDPDKVPADFANIEQDSDMGQVLASVPGTQESKEAVLENSIPQTAEVDRKTTTVEVAYDGDPQFEKCSDDVAYAVNTDKAVFLIDGRYYCCDQAVWFVANGPSGPWQVATAVPEQIQDIPPECPHYNVKYVYIYDSTPDVVYVGYTPGYTCSYVYYGTVVYGTGYWYRPWYYRYYYPRPVTWGFHIHWNPVTGWGFSWGVSFGWLHIRVGRPWYGGWWGPAGYRHGYRHGYHRGYRHGYHHGARAGYRAGYRAGQQSAHRNVYKTQQRKGVHAGGKPKTQPARTPKTANRQNNVYAGKNGNVHRNQGGNWQTRDRGGWSSSSQQSRQSLERQQNSRQRSNQKSNYNRSQQRSRSGGGRRR
jgi:hypothetical protein